MMTAFVGAALLDQRRRKTSNRTISPGRPSISYASSIRRIKRTAIHRNGRYDLRMGSSNAAPSRKQRVSSNLWDFVTILFPLWTVVAAVVALAQPSLFGRLSNKVLMRRMLSVLMLSTGLTLTGRELAGASRRSWALLFAFVCCYVVMPGLAFALMKLFRLTGADGAGLLLLGVVSGGQTSNLCTLIAGGDVALSVAMTTLTSMASVIAIPSLSAWLLGQAVEVNALAVGRSTVELVALPLLLGAALNTVFPGLVRRIKGALPAIGIGAVLVLIVGPVAETSKLFFSVASKLALPVMLLHVLGGLVGFVVPLLFGAGRRTAVTTGFEAGFKSPVLSFVLARGHFGEGVGMASVVSIVVLAPLAALFAVLLRICGSERTGEKKIKQDVRVPWKGYTGGDGGKQMENTRTKFRVVGQDGRSCIVRYEQLRFELERARRRRGVRSVERVTEE